MIFEGYLLKVSRVSRDVTRKFHEMLNVFQKKFNFVCHLLEIPEQRRAY